MLRGNCDAYRGARVASGVAVGYTAPLRCPLTIRVSKSSEVALQAASSGVDRLACAPSVPPRALGRTTLGSLAQRLETRNRSEPRFIRANQGAARSPGPSRAADQLF